MMPANPFRRARRLLPGPALLTLTLALGAPPSGTELEAGGETGAYHYIGACGGPHNYDTYSAQQLRARYRADNGFVVVAEGAALFAEVKASDASAATTPPQVGRHEDHFLLAIRLGYEGRFGGFELGPAAGYLPTQSGDSDGLVLPSAKLWVGRYGAANVWASLLADRTLSLNRIVGAGIGHRSDRVKASLGIAASAGQDSSGIADLDVAVWQNLWLGAGVQVGETARTWGATARVGFFIDDTPRAPRPEPDSEPESRLAPPTPAVELEYEPEVTASVDAGAPGDAVPDAGGGQPRATTP
jgi:hypothetical protein